MTNEDHRSETGRATNDLKESHAMKTETHFPLSILLVAALLLPSCNVKYDGVTFTAVGIMPESATPVPKIFIDTNVTGGMLGGTVRSNKPYDIQTHYMDDTFTFASAKYTKVTVSYADGTTDPGLSSIRLPNPFKASEYESHNSMTGGVVVVNKSRIIRADFPDVISRDEPFTLLIEGKFTKDNGTIIPFTIRERYEVSREKGSQSWAEFVSGC